MIKLEVLHQLLNITDKEIQKLDLNQLRVSLGVFRFSVRQIEREINRRCEQDPLNDEYVVKDLVEKLKSRKE